MEATSEVGERGLLREAVEVGQTVAEEGAPEKVAVAVGLTVAEGCGHKGNSARVTGQVNVATLPLTTAPLDDTGMLATVVPLASTSVTLQPSIAAMLSNSARSALTPPWSHTSLPVAPTVTLTIATPVGTGRVTVSHGLVVQRQEAQPP